VSFGDPVGLGDERPRPMSEINTTPLVDVMLVLLVIFMLTAPLLNHAIRLDLPDVAAAPAVAPAAPVTVSIDAEGRVFWDDQLLADAAALRARLADAARATPPPELHLRADRQARYQSIAEVMAAAQAAGLTRLGFVTDPRAAPPGGAAPAPSATGNAPPAPRPTR
jgi:biopolymer transport protein ExbD